MEYLKLQRSFRRTPAWQGATSAERGAWVSLAGYCGDEENGGRIVGARSWRPAAWRNAIGIDQAEVEAAAAAGLASWDGADLVIAGYDLVGEATYRGRREQASRGGSAPRTTASAPKAKPERTLQDDPSVRSSERSTVRSSEPEAKPEPISISIPISTPRRQRQPARELPPGTSPAVVVAVSLGASLEGDDGIDLTPRWEAALSGLPEATIRAVFAAGPRLLRAGIRYPSGFSQVHEALAAEETTRTADEQRDQRAQHHQAERERCARMLARIQAWLASEEGAKVRAKLSSLERDAIAALEDGNAVGVTQLSRKYPDLLRVAVGERGAA